MFTLIKQWTRSCVVCNRYFFRDLHVSRLSMTIVSIHLYQHIPRHLSHIQHHQLRHVYYFPLITIFTDSIPLAEINLMCKYLDQYRANRRNGKSLLPTPTRTPTFVVADIFVHHNFATRTYQWQSDNMSILFFLYNYWSLLQRPSALCSVRRNYRMDTLGH